MAAQQGPKTAGTNNTSLTHCMAGFDRLCTNLWTILCHRGVSCNRAARVIALWIRPVTSRRHYRYPLQAFRTAMRPQRRQKSFQRNNVLPGLTHAFPYTQQLDQRATSAATLPTQTKNLGPKKHVSTSREYGRTLYKRTLPTETPKRDLNPEVPLSKALCMDTASTYY
ncbi:Hypothetical predicted protein [Pelobates cultripes]|uniref:Uncharacterized protein n=1 Tax=Pelobates cultripes TaxID=61616 RepID=A0AAD1QZC7_PELCU|nr:Hypothetical predicted protein [Pelobates cultripes]